MGPINVLAVFLAAIAWFALGAVWYGPLFGRPWKDALGWKDGAFPAGVPQSRHAMPVVMGLAFAFELLVCLMLGHNIARLQPPAHVVMMMAVGFGAVIMTPALGINYLYQARPAKLFWIDAGYLTAGMALVGAVFVALG
ncbi:DUF1761 domain-containing protein [Parablastomonas sp. CN1-191]|uniref:DUF1761 domain-containing protein n=1 Tax=Parablastomonas sp. CN1-191 TaxID=3400908 RepID=UPI003BF77174